MFSFVDKSAIATVLALTACGGGGGGNNIDAKSTVDSRVCSSLTTGTIDFFQSDPANMYIAWGGVLAGSVGDGNELDLSLEFYGNGASLAGMQDLSTGDNANYGTCEACVTVFDSDSGGNLVKTFFQSAGTLTLTEDPLDSQHLMGSFSNLQVQEVTIDQTSFMSTPVAGGACGTIADVALDHNAVPNSWTCDAAKYNDGTTCDCACGDDPDCGLMNAPVANCANVSQVCYNDACVAPVANDKCTTATALTVNAAGISGTTVDASDNYDAGLEGAGCTGFPQGGGDVAYSVSMTAATQYTVKLTNVDPNFDASLSLVGPGAATVCSANPITTCVKGADAGAEGDPETLVYTAATTGTYYVIVDTDIVGEAGPFTIAVTSP